MLSTTKISAVRPFTVVSDYSPAGDQPEAIKGLVEGLENGLAGQTLLGVTGSGKTFTIANVIQEVQRPTIVLVHNKTLHATLHIGYTNKETMQYESVTFEKDTIPKDLYKHIVASMSIPLILPAVEIDGKKYMDGGVFHSIPIEAINHLVSSYTNKETPLELMILASKPFNYAPKIYKKHFIPL